MGIYDVKRNVGDKYITCTGKTIGVVRRRKVRKQHGPVWEIDPATGEKKLYRK